MEAERNTPRDALRRCTNATVPEVLDGKRGRYFHRVISLRALTHRLVHAGPAETMLIVFIGAGTNPTNLVLTGQVPLILMVSAALAFPISFALIKLYRRAVVRTMAHPGSKRNRELPPVETAQPPPIHSGAQLQPTVLNVGPEVGCGSAAEALCTGTLSAPWRAAAVYGAAGATYAVVMTGCYHAAADLLPVPTRCLFLFWTYAWPVVLTANLVAASTRRAMFMIVGTYWVVFGLIGALVLARNPTVTMGQVAYVWLWMNLPATLLLLGALLILSSRYVWATRLLEKTRRLASFRPWSQRKRTA